MKLLGLIGGTSPESTAIYYHLLNDLARERAGGVHSARLLLWSFDFRLIDAAYHACDWKEYKRLAVEAACALKKKRCRWSYDLFEHDAYRGGRRQRGDRPAIYSPHRCAGGRD